MLKRTVHRSRQLSANSIAKDLQTSCDLQISTTVRMECHQKSEIIIPPGRLKHAATGHWSDKSRFSVCQSDGHIWIWRLPGDMYLPDYILPSV
ncbi:unnamed protein product, partial [Staurois parvus]